ncbi:hypothetical protein B0H10DRAFT_2363672 [Mycena sp. CBHHK59/15]|nr:hypothetical protein B0H10DRAFT_2363672 [Mycena sp. CBHHK59/15]
MFPSNSFRRSYVSLLCLGLALLVAETRASFEDYGIPLSDATVDVKVFNVGTASLVNTTHAFLHPVLPGRQSITFPLFAFLVEHTTSQKRIMFDLGMRKDPMNFAPSISGLFSAGIAQVPPHKDITELLEEGGSRSIPSMLLFGGNHSHFDHIGDMSKFPNTTALVVGPGTDHQLYPEFPNGALQASDFAGHNLTELNFNATHLTFGSLKAIDYFGDGSFYLLNTPGHLAGHISALARVTPTSFIMLAGDAFHHAGQLRPRPHFQHEYPCPAELLEETKSSISTDYFWSWGTHDNISTFAPATSHYTNRRTSLTRSTSIQRRPP